jgi:RNA polymerase sigma-70 factor (ECF subfamily)
MGRYDAGSTSPTLLHRLGNWRDHDAWVEFATRYDPLIRCYCRRYRLDAETTEDLCQRVWIDLTRRICTFRYDPGQTFRGWLRQLCLSRAIDLLRQKQANRVELLDDQTAADLQQPAVSGTEEDVESERPFLLRLAEEVQEAVRRRVDERTWQVFWRIVVEGQPVAETAAAAGMSYFAAFAAQKRVRRMLREEGQRLLATRRALEPQVE